MKICTNCGTAYSDSNYMCPACMECLEPAVTCLSCGEYMEVSVYDICDECQEDWKTKLRVHLTAFREETTFVQRVNLDACSEGRDLYDFARKVLGIDLWI